MKIAFDSRPANDSRGIGRYTSCLLSALRDANRGELVETHQPKRYDVFHSPWIDGAMLRAPVPMVVTLHDVIPLKRPGEYLRSGLRARLRYLAVQRATRVIVPTNAVADDTLQTLEIPAERIVVIGKAVAPGLAPRSESEVAAVRERYRLPEQYLLWVGGMRSPDPRKRIGALLKAKRTMPLVLVGATGHWARELKDVTLTGEINDDDLAAIYTGAHALVYPSSDEGFGLAPVEALACGTPVAACDCPAVREVLGDRVKLTAIDDLDSLIATAQASQRPAPKPPAWTWDDAAEATWDVYEEALSAPVVWRGRRH
ncbi:MAG: glycosyltransferase family 4 protein [Solirubrobacteraceae bacterium]